MADSRPSIETLNKRIVAESFAAWSAGTGGPFDLLAEDATWTIVGRSKVAKIYRGREEFLSSVIRPFNARMRERLIPTVRNIYAEGSTVIVFFDAVGVTLAGTRYSNTYAWFLDMSDGRIVSAYAFFDSIAFDDLWQRVPPGSR
jgi:ketosteroid isomerase-like protein